MTTAAVLRASALPCQKPWCQTNFLEIVPLVEGDQIGHTHKVPWFGAKRQHLQYFEKAFDMDGSGWELLTVNWSHMQKEEVRKKNISHSTSVYITLYAEASIGRQGKRDTSLSMSINMLVSKP